MKTWAWGLGMAVAMALGGCGASVNATTAPGVNLSRYRTFSFYQPPASATRQVGFERSPAGQAVRSQISQDLREKGLVEMPAGAPADFLVSFHDRLQPRYQVNDWGYGPGSGWYAGAGPAEVTEYTEGTLIVDFLDPRTNRVIWRGTASEIVDHPDNPNPDKIAGAVDKLLKKYPSQVASAPPATM